MHHLKFLALLFTVTGALALDNGLARTPALGFNGYNAFGYACILLVGLLVLL
jgi:hypothetical protein